MRKVVELTQILVEYVVSAGAADTFRGSVKFNPWKR